MDLTLQKILEDYWNQVLLLLTAIGIITQMIFSFLLKKKEISHGINHKNRMDGLIRFFNAYAEVKSMWVKLPISQIYENKLTSDEIDGLIQPSLNSFEASVIELQIYFDERLYEKFKRIEKNIFRLNSRFLELAFKNRPDRTLIDKTNDYYFLRQEIEKENTDILKHINDLISKKYR
jgi:hypothetical protein